MEVLVPEQPYGVSLLMEQLNQGPDRSCCLLLRTWQTTSSEIPVLQSNPIVTEKNKQKGVCADGTLGGVQHVIRPVVGLTGSVGESTGERS
jgi:hypothetical protein